MSPLKQEYEYYITLCETLNISRACEILGMQQGSLSKALKKLEDQMEGKLFIRQGRGLKITELGTLLHKQIMEIKKSWESGILKDKEQLSEVSGSLTIGAHPITAIDLLAKATCELNESYPSLNLSLVFKNSSELARDVINHDLDMAIVANPIHHPLLVIRKIRQDYISLWKRKKAHEKIIYFNPEMVGISAILKKYPNYKYVPIADYEVLANIGAKSRGITLLPSPVALRYKNLNKYGKKLGTVDICLIYHVDRPKTSAFIEVLKYIKSQL